MRTTLCTLTLAFLCLLLAPQQARAQYDYCSYGVAWGTSYTWQDGGVVYGYSSTELDYCAGLWYDPETWGRLVEGSFQSENFRTLVEAYATGYADLDPADIYFWYGAPRHNEYYTTDTTHYVREVYQAYTCFYSCGYYWYDPWGYGFAEGGYGGPSFYGYGGAGYWSGRRRRLGDTWYTIQYRAFTCQPGQSFTEAGESCGTPTPTPIPTPTPTPSFTLKITDEAAADITGSTQPVLLDARTTLKAVTDPADANTTFQWTIGGEAVFDQNTSATSQNVVVRWPKEGTFTASVTATRNGGQRTAKVDIKVAAPEFVSMTAVEVPVQFNPPGVCIDPNQPSVSLGCGTTSTNAGIEITASAKVPPKYISASGDGRLKFVQIGTSYTSRLPLGSTQLQCRTRRATSNDRTSGWMLDDSDPYASAGTIRGVPLLTGFDYTAGTSTIRVIDSPNNTIGGYKEFFRDDFFETYVVYFTGEINQPRTQRVVSVLPWGWQAKTLFDDAAQAYRLVSSSPTAAQNLTGAAVPGAKSSVAEVRGYQGRLQDMIYASCGSTVPPNAPPKAAGFVSQDVPFALDAGQTYAVTVSMRNNGSMTWTPDVFKLGSQSPQDNFTWGTNRVYLSAPVEPGADAVFTFNITAPSYPGTYDFQWRMVHEGVEWFGDPSPVMQITVSDPFVYCDWYQESDCYNRGGYWDASSCSCYGGYYYY